MMNPSPGWYPTPDDNLRYWDGDAWTDHVAPMPTTSSATATSAPGRSSSSGAAGVGGWIGLGLTALLGLVTSGLSGLLLVLGVFGLVVGVVALLRGQVRWARLGSRAAGATAIAAAVALLGVGTAIADDPSGGDQASPTADRRPDRTWSPTEPSGTASPRATASPSTTPTTDALTPASAARGTALAAVAKLEVGGRGPKTGYSRAAFGQAWFDTDRNGCDTRNDVLRRDLTQRTMKNSCKVLAGVLAPDPYTGSTTRFVYGGTSEVDVDHLVSLSDAWQKGAARWQPGKRLAFANDPLNLVAVGASTNRSKGDGDTATWLPPDKSSRCDYVARQVAVKNKYAVRVTAAERAAMVRVLATCPGRALPAAGSAPTVAALPRTPATRAPAPRATHRSAPRLVSRPEPRPKAAPLVVHPGAFCSPEGALGVTDRGTAMACTTKPGDDRARWRSR